VRPRTGKKLTKENPRSLSAPGFLGGCPLAETPGEGNLSLEGNEVGVPKEVGSEFRDLAPEHAHPGVNGYVVPLARLGVKDRLIGRRAALERG